MTSPRIPPARHLRVPPPLTPGRHLPPLAVVSMVTVVFVVVGIPLVLVPPPSRPRPLDGVVGGHARAAA